DLLEEHLGVAVLAVAQAVTPLGMLVQGKGGEGDEAVDRHGGAQDVEQFDRGDPAVEQVPTSIAVGGNCGHSTALGGPVVAAAHGLDQLGEGVLGSSSSAPASPVPGTDGRGAVDHGVQVVGAAFDLAFGE